MRIVSVTVGTNRVLIECDCGHLFEVGSRGIREGRTKRCRSCAGKLSVKKKHGFRANGKRESLYVKWVGIKGRCNNKNNKDYDRFGGRGITFDSKWSTYAVFRDWAYKNGYKEGYSLYRRDIDKGYAPSNCFCNSKRPLKRYRFRDEYDTLESLHKRLKSNVSLALVHSRILKGWEITEAFLRPIGVRVKKRRR